MFVLFTRHIAPTHHTFKDRKEAYIRKFSLKLPEFAQDVIQAIQDEKPYVFTTPVRDQARPSTLLMPNCPAQAGKTPRTAEATGECLFQRNLSCYKAQQERVKLNQKGLLLY